MEFIKKMKKRENIEMSIKTIIAVLACFIAIILMEGMIYGIKLNSNKTNPNQTVLIQSQSTVAYCIKEANDKYFVLYYNKGMEKNGATSDWTAQIDDFKTEEECKALKSQVKQVIFGAPNAFEYSIKPFHYAIIAVFVLGVSGYFVYRFIALNKEYKKIEDKFNKTGEIEITNF